MPDSDDIRDEFLQRTGRELRSLVLSWTMGNTFATVLKKCQPNAALDRSWGELAWTLQQMQMNGVDLALGEGRGLRIIREDEDEE